MYLRQIVVGILFILSSLTIHAELDEDLNVSTVKALHEKKAVYLIDVREQWEFKKSHIDGVSLIPLRHLPQKLDTLPTDKPIILLCASGFRSDKARNLLEAEGFKDVHHMIGGMQAWEQAGYPTKP